MKKNMKELALVFLIIFLVLLLIITFKIIVFRKEAITNIEANGSKLSFDFDSKRDKVKYLDVYGESNRKISKVKDLKVFIGDESLLIKDSIYEKNLRYYFSLEDLKDNGQVLLEGSKVLNKRNKDNYIDLDLGEIYIDGTKKALRGEILNIENKKYISLNDFKEILSLRDDWYSEKNSIYMYFGKDKNISDEYKVKEGKAALIRIEDVTAGGVFSKDNNMEKMKFLGDYFEKNNIVFHIAWIPRYVNPEKGIDNDLLENNTFENVHFINMLDHLINRGAIIGLHGYTHQHKNEISALGVELKWNVNSQKDKVVRIVESSLKTAKTLNIPVGFFESPHYKADRNQQKIIEEYFPIMFEPYAGYWNFNPIVSLSNKSTIYVPAPLGYVKDNGDKVSKKIKNCSDKILTALFIHPYIFLGSIEDTNDPTNMEEVYKFKEDSPIIKIISALKERGCKTITVEELNKEVK